MDIVQELRGKHERQFRHGKMLSSCVTMARSVGDLAEHGRQMSFKESAINTVTGGIQVGEYILTGAIPDAELVQSLLFVKPTENTESEEVAQ